jgi:hypothetical protein
LMEDEIYRLASLRTVPDEKISCFNLCICECGSLDNSAYPLAGPVFHKGIVCASRESAHISKVNTPLGDSIHHLQQPGE